MWSGAGSISGVTGKEITSLQCTQYLTGKHFIQIKTVYIIYIWIIRRYGWSIWNRSFATSLFLLFAHARFLSSLSLRSLILRSVSLSFLYFLIYMDFLPRLRKTSRRYVQRTHFIRTIPLIKYLYVSSSSSLLFLVYSSFPLPSYFHYLLRLLELLVRTVSRDGIQHIYTHPHLWKRA